MTTEITVLSEEEVEAHIRSLEVRNDWFKVTYDTALSEGHFCCVPYWEWSDTQMRDWETYETMRFLRGDSS